MAHLQDAASAAYRYKIDDLEAVAVTRMQSAPAIPWTTLEREFNLPASQVELFLRQFETPVNWRDALGRWLDLDSPTGKREDNEQLARRSWTARFSPDSPAS